MYVYRLVGCVSKHSCLSDISLALLYACIKGGSVHRDSTKIDGSTKLDVKPPASQVISFFLFPPPPPAFTGGGAWLMH